MIENVQLKEAQVDTGQASLLHVASEKKNVSRVLAKNPLVVGIVLVLGVIGLLAGFRYWQDAQSKVYIEKSGISAPVISVGPETAGILKALFVKEGDRVSVGQQLFNVGDRVTSARAPGIITMIQNTPGQFAGSQTAIVQMYDPNQLRVIGHIQEDQGLSDIRVGQKVMFTVDAYGSKEYQGTIERVAAAADQGNVVFSISDKRQQSIFSVTAAFDVSAYPELKNGMSAKMWVSK
ncbi:MAG: HlyD family efflux transporter periplasmic adaptor subunit [Chloroflexi bacterium]|nr:HlyD family efflux transporter periplasmic adaptor subunit [Chloroflexota bacterium]